MNLTFCYSLLHIKDCWLSQKMGTEKINVVPQYGNMERQNRMKDIFLQQKSFQEVNLSTFFVSVENRFLSRGHVLDDKHSQFIKEAVVKDRKKQVV